MKAVVEHPRCPYCHDSVKPDDDKAACHRCMSWHHTECSNEHCGCAACGHDELLRLDRAAPPPTGAVRVCLRCPKAPLAALDLDGMRVLLCRRCGGWWIPVERLYDLLAREVSDKRPRIILRPEPAPQLDDGFLCPGCGKAMAKLSWRRLLLDVCVVHGLWLESTELVALRQLCAAYPEEAAQVVRLVQDPSRHPQ